MNETIRNQMNNSDTIKELCIICEMQNNIIRAQSDALNQLGAMVMEEEKAVVAERYASVIGGVAPSEEEGA